MNILFTKNKEECIKKIIRKQTNKKFTSFDHILFTIGDYNDFSFHVILRLMLLLETYLFEDLRDTFNYIFEILKKGNIGFIKNNKLEFFLPFSNYYFQNPVIEYLHVNEKDLQELKLLNQFKKKNDIENYFKLEKKNNRFMWYLLKSQGQLHNRYLERRKWVVNGCFFRNEKYEGDKFYNLYHHFFYEYSKYSNIQNENIIYFFNIRDFPIARKNNTYPYHNIVKDLKLNYQINFPILSLCTTDDHKDICMPTPDDLTFIYDDILFPPKICDFIEKKKLQFHWNKKKNKVCFRGSATGCGITSKTNMRIKAYEIGQLYPDLFDIGITNSNSRLKKFDQDEKISFLEKKYESSKLNYYQQSEFKYLLVIEGHVAAFRLSYQMFMNCCILLQDSKYKLWYSNLLIPYKHYIPIKYDLSDLVEKTQWCLKNEQKCKNIARQSKLLITKILTKKFCYQYMDNIFKKYCIFKIPPKINIQKKIALISIYRDNSLKNRSKQKKIFIDYYQKIHNNIDIFIIEQSKKHDFNIGMLKNIGYDLIKNKNYDYYIFSDIDLLPDDQLSHYLYNSQYFPLTLAARGTLYENLPFNQYIKYYENNIYAPYTHFIGGINIFNKHTFEKINGYPNHFWGWGGEDVILLYRLFYNHFHLYYPKKGRVIDIENNIDINQKMKTLKDSNENKECKREEKIYEYFINNTLKQDGLTNIKEKYIVDKIINKNHFVVTLKKDKFHFTNNIIFNDENFKIIKKKNKYFINNTIKKIKIIFV